MDQHTAVRRLRQHLIAGGTAAARPATGVLVSGDLLAGADSTTLPATSVAWRTGKVTLQASRSVDRAERTRTVVHGARITIVR